MGSENHGHDTYPVPRDRMILERISDGVVFFDREMNYLYVNLRGAELLGRSPEDLVGRNYWQEYPEARGTPFAEAYRKAIATGAVMTLEEFYEPWQKWFENRIYPTEKGIMILFTDTTEKHRAEQEKQQLLEQLQHAKRLESIGRLAGGIAHDFNNMLTVILGRAEMLGRDLGDDPRQEDLQEIVRAGEYAADLTRQLLAFSRRQVLEPKVVDLNGMVRGIEAMLRHLLEENIDFRVALSPASPRAFLDPGQIEQVLVNLVLNARDAMPHGGTLTLETACVELDADYVRRHSGDITPGEYVMVAVTDTGQGMDKQTQERIFEPFFTTKERGKGTGLGLATVYGIVRQSGGNIWVYSEPGRGTCFKVYFPRTTAEPAPDDEEAQVSGPVPATIHLLVVEDEPALRRLIRTGLEKAGYRVTVAASGDEAVAMLPGMADKPDAVLTDVVMPGLNGPATAARIREIVGGIPVLYMSGYTDNAIVHHGVLDQGVPFIGKPFTMDQMLKALGDVLRGRA